MLLNKFFKNTLLTLLMLVAVFGLCAWSVSDYYLGNPVYTFSARNMAMGNTGVYDTFSSMSIAINPANAVLINGKYGISGTGLFSRNEDSRSIPLYNSFDTFIDDATYSSNINMFDDYGVAGFGKYRLKNYTAGIGIHYLPIVNFKGTYVEEVRNNRNSDNDGYPEIIAMNEFNNTGNLNALGFSLGGAYAFSSVSNVNFGVTYDALNGQSKMQKSIRWSEWAMQQSINSASLNRNVLPDSIYTNKADLDGSQVKLGLAFTLNERWGIGLSYAMKSKMDRESNIRIAYGPDTTMVIPPTSINLPTIITTDLIKDKYILPNRIRAGFNYQPRNIMRTYFNAEVEYVKWTEVSKMFDDCWDLHVGVEHKVTNRIPLRLGFQSITEWQATPDYTNLSSSGQPALEAMKIITPTLTAGSSVDILDNLVLDIGLSFSWREYQALDMFRDGYYNDKNYTGMTAFILWPNSHIMPADRGWENPDKVRESFTQISTGLTWTW
jgi:hypothetical protein